jgi:DNA-binding protein HU-beta
LNKRDLVTKIAVDAQLTRAQASRAVDAFIAGVQAGLLRGDRVTLSGFGSFAVSQRKARSVRNPRSGAPIRIDARRAPRFAPAIEFKAAVNRDTGPLP